MTAASYLSLLDGVLRAGTALLPHSLRQLLAQATLRHALPGGFRGRRGGPDLYYTDFGLRLLALLDPTNPLLQDIAISLPALCARPQSVVEVFCALNCRRIVAGAGVPCPLNLDSLRTTLSGHRLPFGGYSGGGTQNLSAYATFLAALCYDMMGERMPGQDLAARQIAALQGPGGGFREQAQAGPEQSNATAAATAFLHMAGALGQDAQAAAVRFLVAAQGPDGGLRAHPTAPHGDLLSTFTGLVALLGLGAAHRLDWNALVRFVRASVTPEGEFGAWPGSCEGDVEYLYYGLGCLAIVAGIAQDH